ncbi:SDR family oxidoreductase [Peribacillus sp. SCS-37]|uniref:SDR family oxidoreductase n=1 Tax=Paraperibacillus esterisolvens TaxID=3115296 RepID=UPI0039066DEA
MKVLVVGANGQVGKKLVKMLVEDQTHEARAMVRKEEQAGYFKELGAETVIANLEDTPDAIAKAAEGCEAIVFSAGAGGKGYDKTLLIDLDGAVKTMEAAKKAGIDRFVMVSALQADNRENWNKEIMPYYAAKYYADRVLKESGLTYTIIRPGALLNEPGTGKVKAASNLERGSIPREDVAAAIFAALQEEKVYNRAFDIVQGDSSIEDALHNLD